MTDASQFETFMRAYQDMVFTTAARLLGNPTEAEDISQEVFLKAYDRFDELSSSATAGGWLKVVTRNLCLNYLSRYRSRWRFFSEFFSGESNDLDEIEFPAADTLRDALDTADQREALQKALLKLPATQRVPVVLYHFEQLTYEEIAAHLRISLSKVKTDIFRGRAALRRQLALQSSGNDWSEFKPKSQPRPAARRASKSNGLTPATLLAPEVI